MPLSVATVDDAERAGRPLGPALVVLFAIAIILTRLPLLGNGYGSDPDSWRNAVAALHMRAVGHYLPSRVPGFPVFEVLLAALVPGGWVASNAAAVLAELAAAAVFAQVLMRRRRPVLWPLLGFAFGAPLWVHATQTMDYAFGLAFFLAAYYAALDRRPAPAGLLMALATGCRPTYALAAVALMAMMVVRRDPARDLAKCAAGFGLAALALFTPVLLSPEGRGLVGHLSHHASKAHVTAANAVPIARGAVVHLFGKVATALAAVSVLAAFARRRPAARQSGDGAARARDDRAARAFEAIAVVLIGGFFLLIPYEEAYLLPLLPLALVALAGLLPRALLIAAMLAMATEPLVSVQFDQRRLVPGRLFQEIAQRRRDLAATRALLDQRPDTPSVYVVGRFQAHRLAAMGRDLEITAAGWAPFHAPGVALRATDRRVAFAEDLEPAQMAALVRSGWTVVRLATPEGR